MDAQDVVAQVRDAFTVKRVFGDPYEKDGMTVIPVAKVMNEVEPLLRQRKFKEAEIVLDSMRSVAPMEL